MAESTEHNTGTMPVAERQRFDVAALTDYLRMHLAGFEGPLTVEQFKGGQSNPTFMLRTPARSYVMRSKPGPVAKLLPSAHAIEREYRVMSALSKTEVPVAQVYCLCEDEAVIGRAFYVMEHMDGRILWDQTLPGMARDERSAIYDEMNRVIALLHNTDFEAIGLSGFGKPGNYFTRQIGRWSKQYRASETQRIDEMDRLIDWLPAHIPQGDETCIVHGDYRLDNMVFDATQPKIRAILDWELCTLGHPLADFSYHCMSYHIEPGQFRGIKGVDLPALGIPTEREYIAAYCARTGRDRIDNWHFYLAYNMFRLAAILQGIVKRAADGTASNQRAAEQAARVRPLAEAGWRFAEQVDAAAR